jgi:hypothetical protein
MGPLARLSTLAAPFFGIAAQHRPSLMESSAPIQICASERGSDYCRWMLLPPNNPNRPIMIR